VFKELTVGSLGFVLGDRQSADSQSVNQRHTH